LQLTAGVDNTGEYAAQLQSANNRVAAMELLEESEKVSSLAPTARLESENKWIALLFQAVTARLTSQTDAMLCGSRFC
jgi:hypothetical protein